MRKLSTPFRRPRKLTAKIAVTIGAALVIMLGISAPAYASGSLNSLLTATHTCEDVGDDTSYDMIFCVDLALYITQEGQYDLTLQVEGYCQSFIGPDTKPCLEIYTYGTIANPSYTDWTKFDCSGSCQSIRTYFYPFGGLPITPGNCDNDVWGVLDGDSESYFLSPLSKYIRLGPQLETGHYNVCLSSVGTLSATRV
jgi:hypothetical protein